MDYKKIAPETPENPEGEEESETKNIDLSSPNPCQVINENENPKKKVFDLDYNGNYFLFSLTNVLDKYLAIELIPVEGSLPYPYRAIYSLQILNLIKYCFKDFKTIDECMNKVISLFLKNRLTLYRDEEKDLFYIILKITIIDEDKYIPLKLSCTKEVHVCTIRYIYKGITGLRKEYDEYKASKLKKIEEQSKEIKNLKEKNEKFLKIIQNLKNINNEGIKNRFDQLNYKIINLEKDLIYQKMKFKCEIIPNQKIIIFPAQNAQKGFNVEFKIKNIGYSFLSTKYDRIYFDRNVKMSSPEIDFFNKKESEIKFDDLFKPNDILLFNLKFIIKNAKEDQIYNFYININSTLHGIISSKPLIIQTLIYPENIKEDDLPKHLENNFEINLKWNNIYVYDIEGKQIDIKNKIKERDSKYLAYPIREDEEEEHVNRYIGDKNKKKTRKKKPISYLERMKGEIKQYLKENKNAKISENKMVKIIERLNVEYFASCWLDHKEMFDIIIEKEGHYHQIAKIVEDKL